MATISSAVVGNATIIPSRGFGSDPLEGSPFGGRLAATFGNRRRFSILGGNNT